MCPLQALRARFFTHGMPYRKGRTPLMTSSSSTPPLLGATLLDRYTLVDVLGEGGFGQVFAANIADSDAEAAIKILKESSLENEVHRQRTIARFRREADLCARLHHPNIVHLLESGRTRPRLVSGAEAEPVFFIAFERVVGTTLATLLAQEGQLSMRETVRLMIQVLEGLSAAHAHGIIHRDIKPHNLMIQGLGFHRRALILDFGLGSLLEQLQRDATRLTSTFEVLGTPAYASPEQLRAQPVTPRSDLYAWGLIFLECLTGRRVMSGASIPDIIRQQLAPTPIAMPDWLLRLPLGQLLRRVLQRDPLLRPASASLLLEELHALESDTIPAVAQGAETLSLHGSPGELEGTSTGLSHTLVYTPGAESLHQPPPIQQDETLSLDHAEGPNMPTLEAQERRPLTILSLSLQVELPAQPTSSRAQGSSQAELRERLLQGLLPAALDGAARFDGTVLSILGERAVLAFGITATRDDDGLRAARAAHLLRAELTQLGEDEAIPGVRFHVRMGLHSGLCSVVRSSQGAPPIVLGQVPVLAMELETEAQAGEILASHTLSQTLRQRFAWTSCGVYHSRSSAQPVLRCRLDAEWTGRRSQRGGGLSPLVGRSRHLDALLERWKLALTGDTQAITLVGEPGMGKSRLLHALQEQVDDAAKHILEVTTASENRMHALWPLTQLLSQLIGQQRDWSLETAALVLRQLLQRLELPVEPHLAVLAQLLGLPPSVGYVPEKATPQRQKAQRIESLAALLRALCSEGPVLLIVEDLHWADVSTLETLGPLLEQLGGMPLLAVFTSRPGAVPLWHGCHHELRSVEQLEPTDAARLITALLDGKTLPQAVLDLLTERAGGNPLYLEELTRTVLESGVLETQGTRWVLARPLAELQLPDSLRSVLRSRLERLGERLETLQLAAVLGSEFDFALLCAVFPRDEASLRAQLEALVQAEFLSRRFDGPQEGYLFRHALIRDVAYEAMPGLRRKQLHARVATLLEQHFPDVVASHPDWLAWHHAAAEQSVEAIGYAQRAAMNALQRSAYIEALEQAGQARSWLSGVERLELRRELELALQLVSGPAMIATRGFADEAIRALVERSELLLSESPDSPLAIPVTWLMQMYHHTRAHEEQALTLSRSLVARAEKTGNLDLLVASLPNLGSCLYGAAAFDEARSHLERCIALYDEHQHGHHATVYGWDSRVFAQSTLALVLWSQGHSDAGLASAHAALRSAEALKDAMSVGQAYIYVAILHQYRQEREALIAVCQEAIERCDRQGVLMASVLCSLLLGWALQDVERIRGASATILAMGVYLASSYYRLLVAETELACGELDAAGATLAEIHDYIQASGEIYYRSEVLRFEAKLLLTRRPEAIDAARELLQQAQDAARSIRSPLLVARVEASLAELPLPRSVDEKGAEATATSELT